MTLNGGADIQTGTGTLYLANDGANVLVRPGSFGGQSVISGRLGLSPGTHRSTAYPGWTLQQAGKVPGPFSNSPLVPAIAGSRYVQTNATTGTNPFYRLAK